MKTRFYTRKNVVDNVHDSSLQAIITTWSDLGPHAYLRPCVSAQLEVVQKNLVKSMIYNLKNSTGVLRAVDQDWLGEEVFPRYEKAGLKAIITIPSKSAMCRLSSNWFLDAGQQFDIDFIEVPSLDQALEKAQEYL